MVSARSWKNAVFKAIKSIWNALPVILGVVLLVSLTKAIVPSKTVAGVLSNSMIIGPLIGGALGSILAGNPVTSYVIGGELIKQGVGLVTVTSFLLAWVTVGIVQLPAESILLGKRFALTRNAVAFLLSIVGALMTFVLVNIL